MEFKTIQEAFNHWNGKSLNEIEKRAQEVKGMIETDPDVNITALNIELTGLAEAKANATAKAEPEARSFNPITGGNFANAGVEATTGDVYASKEYRSAFYKSMLGKELTGAERVAFNRALEIEKRADAYITSGNTPVVIPTTTLNEIISKARAEGGIMAHCRAFNMPTKVSVLVATPTANASWNTEGANADSVEPDFDSVSFDGYEVMKQSQSARRQPLLVSRE